MINKFDWDDISIIPAILSDINSRSEVNNKWGNKLPLITSPMDTVIDENNIKPFEDNGFVICLPRNVRYETVKNDDYFYSYGLEEAEDLLNKGELPKKVLIDIANGHMQKLYDLSKRIKEETDVILMVGNIANPETYKHYSNIGVDYIRCGIGGGSVCTTSANGAVHYPMGSLISEINEIKKYRKTADLFNTKVVADGGFSTFDEIIKALALGADYVMLGSVLNKAFESCSPFYKTGVERTGDTRMDRIYIEISKDDAIEHIKRNEPVYKKYRGMSTKEVQRDWNRKELRTSEGISKYNKVEYNISGWVENFSDYLKTNMSYCGKTSLEDYVGKVEYIFITDNAFNRFNK